MNNTEQGLLQRRILELTMLKENWDSYGGKPTTGEAAQRMFSLLRTVVGYPGIVSPTVGGGITAEWREGPTTVIVEFSDAGELSFYWSDEDLHVEQESKVSPPPTATMLRCMSCEFNAPLEHASVMVLHLRAHGVVAVDEK